MTDSGRELVEEAREYEREARRRERENDYRVGEGGPSPSDDITMLCEDVRNLCDEVERLRDALLASQEREWRLRAVADAAHGYRVFTAAGNTGKADTCLDEMCAALEGMWGHWGDYRDARGILARLDKGDEQE
jgi:hypothetical protein